MNKLHLVILLLNNVVTLSSFTLCRLGVEIVARL